MKPTGYKYQISGQEESYQVVIASELITRKTAHYPEKLKIVPLYTAHEIADFVKGLYFDDNFRGHKEYYEIAEKIEEGAKK